MNGAHLAFFVVAALSVVFAIIGYAVYVYQVSAALQQPATPRLPKNAYNWYMASGALFVIGLVIFFFFAYWQFQAIRTCNKATGRSGGSAVFQGSTVWLVGLVL